MTSFKEELATKIKARFPIIFLTSFEERRVERILQEICTDQQKTLIIWTATKGFVSFDGKVVSQGATDLTEALTQVIDDARTKKAKAIYLFKDLHRWIAEQSDKTIYRMLRDAVETIKASPSTIIVLAPTLVYPKELEKSIAVLDVPYSDRAELKVVLDNVVGSAKAVKSAVEYPNDEELDTILRSGLGLTQDEFEGILAESLVKSMKIDAGAIVKAKEQIIRKSGVLDFTESVETLDNIGGLENLKDWIRSRASVFTEKAKAFGVRAPRGIMALGITGTGKSLAIKACASYLKLPLLTVDASKILGSFVGDSEKNLRQVLKVAEAVSPAILFFDEAEKMWPQGTSGDSGVSSRLFGSLLSWMQDRPADKPVLVAMTCNDPLKLPPELFSRFDATWFVDLPNEDERLAIWDIQVRKAGRDPQKFVLQELAKHSEGYSGREVEMIVSEGLVRAFGADHELDTEILLNILKERTPLSVTRRPEIEAMRRWGRANAMAASKSIGETGEGRTVEL